jgi:hypothetical protein
MQATESSNNSVKLAVSTLVDEIFSVLGLWLDKLTNLT